MDIKERTSAILDKIMEVASAANDNADHKERIGTLEENYAALEENYMMLMECILEMSEIVYA